MAATLDGREFALKDAELRIRVGVADLLETYQLLADCREIRELAALFASDAVPETQTAKYVGPDDVLGFWCVD